MTEPPRRPWPEGGFGSGGSDDPHHPAKPPRKKRPRSAAAEAAAEAGALLLAGAGTGAAAGAVGPPSLADLRRSNAARWGEVRRLREELLARRRRRADGGGGIAAVGSDADRRIAAYRAELALVSSRGEEGDGTGENGGEADRREEEPPQHQEEELRHRQQRQRNVRAILSNRAAIEDARRRHDRVFGNEIVETYDGLVQVNAHLDRAIGIPPRLDPPDGNGDGGGAGAQTSRAMYAASAAMSLHDRLAEAEARVEEHRTVHAALIDMMERGGIGIDVDEGGGTGGAGTDGTGTDTGGTRQQQQ